MHDYVAPQLTLVGTITDLTMGDLLSPGQDHYSHIPLIGKLFGS